MNVNDRKGRLLELAKSALRAAQGDDAEAAVHSEKSYLTRYANSHIHQNVTISNVRVGLRVRMDGRAGVAWTNGAQPDNLRELARQAKDIALHSPPVELPEMTGSSPPEAPRIDEETRDPDRGEVAGMVSEAIREMKPFAAFGGLSGGITEAVYANSKGVEAYHGVTDAHFVANAMEPDGYATGWGQTSATRIADLKPLPSAERARQKAEASREVADLPPGQYSVILEEPAVGDLIQYLNWMGLSGRGYYEGRAFTAGRLGKKIFSEKLTITDDPLNMDSFSWPFDAEGAEKRLVTAVERGVLKELATDRKTAKLLGVAPNGNAPSYFVWSPLYSNLFVKAGSESRKQLVANAERAVLVTRFWYVNPLEPKRFLLTGMTRDGTFLVENGKITKALKNLRFTQNMEQALCNIEAIGDTPVLLGSTTWYRDHVPYGTVVPPMRISGFSFNSGTEF